MSYLAQIFHRVDVVLSLWTRARAESDLLLTVSHLPRTRLRH
jgi:hypothetical protein